jgi:DNA ligase-1
MKKLKTRKHSFATLYKRTTKGETQEWEIWVEDDGDKVELCTRYGLSDGKKQTLREEIREGKNLGKKNETTPFEQAVLEAQGRWNKQLTRKGYGKTVEQSAHTRSISPMLAQVYEKNRGKINWEAAFAQPKLDGFRGLARRAEDGTFSFTSRENKPMPALTSLCGLLGGLALPDGVVAIDGELWHPELPLNLVAKGCKAVNEYTEKLQYHVYDVILRDTRFEERYDVVRSLVDEVGDSRVVLVDTVKVRSEGDLMFAQSRYIEEGYEGAMLRHGGKGYEAGKRSDTLLKVKTFQDAEFEIVDWKPGRGKYAGVPVFTCATAEGHSFDVLAPGDMREKAALGERADALVGKLLKVKYQYLTKTDEPVPFLPVAIAVVE